MSNDDKTATPAGGVPARTATPVRGVRARTATPVAGVPTRAATDRTGPVELPRKDRRALAIALGLIATVALAVAAFSPRWLGNASSIYEDDLSLGLRSYSTCHGATCTSDSLSGYVDKLTHVSSAFPTFGWVTFVLCVLGIVALLIATLLAIARRQPEWPITSTTIAFLAIAGALICGCVFCAIQPGEAGEIGVAWGFYVFGAGAVAGLAGAQLLARSLRPDDPDLAAGAMNPDDF